MAGAHDALAAVVDRYAVVAVVTGRRSEEVAAFLPVPGLRFLGLYGMEEAAPELRRTVMPRAQEAAAVVPEAWVEDKGISVAIHYRQAPDPLVAREALLGCLGDVAMQAGLEVMEGKMVIELVPPGHRMKGGAVERLVADNALSAVLFAGDDVADLDAFASLDRLNTGGLITLKVAVRGPETPDELLAAADVVVDGPEGLVALLRRLT